MEVKAPEPSSHSLPRNSKNLELNKGNRKKERKGNAYVLFLLLETFLNPRLSIGNSTLYIYKKKRRKTPHLVILHECVCKYGEIRLFPTTLNTPPTHSYLPCLPPPISLPPQAVGTQLVRNSDLLVSHGHPTLHPRAQCEGGVGGGGGEVGG